MQSYSELVSLTKSYLLAQYDLKERLPVSAESVRFFGPNKPVTARVVAVPPPPAPAAARPPLPPPPKPVPKAAPVVAAKPVAPVAKAPEPKKADEPIANGKFALTPLSGPAPVDHNELRQLLGKLAPGLKLVDPEKALPERSWPPDAIALLVTRRQIGRADLAFLRQVAFAIEKQFGACGIVYDDQITQATQLPQLIRLPDPAIYLREPQRKAQLWSELAQQLSAHKT